MGVWKNEAEYYLFGSVGKFLYHDHWELNCSHLFRGTEGASEGFGD